MPAAISEGGGQGEVKNRGIITISIMAATLMNSLDTTIANVALPHIQGSVSASQDQITWVLTSYIVAAAIMTPLTGWLAGRFGRKLVFMISISGFTVASALCGISNSLVEIVLFRLLQGTFGAALIPLSQAVLLDINPPEKHGQAMAVWGAGAILGPILGPALGGYLTDNLSWRWVFYINLPIGILAFLGVFLFIQEHKQEDRRPFDFFGFATLAIAIGAFQLMLDRGQTQDWFKSTEVQLEAVVAVTSLYLFIVQRSWTYVFSRTATSSLPVSSASLSACCCSPAWLYCRRSWRTFWATRWSPQAWSPCPAVLAASPPCSSSVSLWDAWTCV
jgi:DHA2 family multidrug resistance protein